jgi:hypothetical protein
MWIFIGIIAVEIVCESLFKLPSETGEIVNIAIAVTLGSQGNNLYRWHVEKRLRELAPNDVCNGEVRMQLAKVGGTNIGAGVGFVAIVVIVGMSIGWALGLLEQGR